MQRSSIQVGLGLFLLTLGTAGPVAAQVAHPSTVTGQGTVELKRQPEILRVQVEVLAKGKDLAEALAKLKDRRQAAEKQLAAIGALKSGIEFGEPRLSSEKSPQQKQMEMMVLQQMRSQGKKVGTKPAGAPPAVISSLLKAEFPLKASSPEELLLTSHALQEKIKAADLGGLKELKKPTPQEEELLEEMEGLMQQNEEQGPIPGQPMFLFVSRIPELEQTAALARAFEKAKAEATRLAKAAGATLGPLHQLSNTTAAQGGFDDPTGMYNNPYYYQPIQRMQLGQSGSESQSGEAAGMQPGKVVFRIAVTASFALQAPGK